MKQELSLTTRICITLFKEQLDYINGDPKLLRRKIFNALVSRTVSQTTEVNDKRFHVTLQQGQCLISEVELAKIAGCNRKTVHAILTEFEQMGISTSESVQQRTSVHTLYCIMSWSTNDALQYNRFFDRRASNVLFRVARQNEKRKRESVAKKEKKASTDSSLDSTVGSDVSKALSDVDKHDNVASGTCPDAVVNQTKSVATQELSFLDPE